MAWWKFASTWLYGGAAVLGTLMSIVAFVSPDGAWPLCAAAIGCLMAANVGRFTEISASASGFRFLVKDAQAKVAELSRVSILASKAALSVVQRSGRWGGFSEDEKDEMLSETLAVLREAGLDEEAILQIRHQSWDKYVHFDYVLAITGGNTMPNVDDQQFRDDWHALRKFERRTTPDELEALLKRGNGLHGLRKELLENFRFYLAHHYHKSPEIWRQRNKVKRIPD